MSLLTCVPDQFLVLEKFPYVVCLASSIHVLAVTNLKKAPEIFIN